ncbi:MAG: low molecular weight phosphotyrosine protein phosphatase [Gammaproteobacteria bacterium]|nr:low molecular weight phosphotyrosine protein phosphatase [Gammaproteobacteria bacterium]
MTRHWRLLFVCTGNLCRSPLAQGLMQQQVDTAGLTAQFSLDSAGTHARAGQPPEPLAIEVAVDYGADIGSQRSRVLRPEDFFEFDRIIAMDLGHLDELKFMQPATGHAEVTLLLAGLAASGNAEVPDPYGRDRGDFEFAARLIAIGTRRLLNELRAT